MEETSFSGVELAGRARVAPEVVARLVELGILRPGPGATPFGLGDVRRVRLVDACGRAGLSLEGIGRAITEGRLSLAFLDLMSIAGQPLTGTTYAELCDEQALPMELVQRVHEASGLGRPQPDDPIHPLDRDLLGSAQLGRLLGLDDGVLIRVARVYGENLRRIAQAEPEFYHDHVEQPLLASGMDEQQMRAAATQMSDQLAGVVQRMLVALYTRHQERYTIDHLVEHIEAVVAEERPRRPPAMCFLDLAGFTRLTEERGDRAAAALASSLADLVERVSLPHGGQPVKWLGDGVMFHFKQPGQGVVAALEMVERTPQAGLPPAHVGLHAGPVVFQDGDYFGRTVNLAARIAGHAGPGEVLVSDQVVAECPAGPVGFEPIGPVPLKGVTDPVPLHRAARKAPGG
ncbi:MAG TPA: adenylate cyclase regulatory domain-containing protein [Actinomycetota bacterium]